MATTSVSNQSSIVGFTVDSDPDLPYDAAGYWHRLKAWFGEEFSSSLLYFLPNKIQDPNSAGILNFDVDILADTLISVGYIVVDEETDVATLIYSKR